MNACMPMLESVAWSTKPNNCNSAISCVKKYEELHGLMAEYIDFFVNRSFALFTCAGTINNSART